MGQKVNPTGLRSGLNLNWGARWFADKKTFGDRLGEDLKIRKYFEDTYTEMGIGSISIERDAKSLRVIVKTSKQGVLLGRSGDGAEKIEKALKKIIKKDLTLVVEDERKPDTDAVIVAEGVCRMLERRMPFRRVAKQAIQKALEGGAKGAKVSIAGRLGGADMARSEFFTEGSVPLHTLRSDISYSADRAETTYGTLGVKVWIYNGDVFKKRKGMDEEVDAIG